MKFLLSSQDIQNYKFLWQVSKENYKKQKGSMFLMFLLVMFTAFFTTLLPYLLKIIIDYSAQEYNFSLDIRLPFNFLYLIVLAYAAAWLANELCHWTQNIFSAYLMVDFKGALIFAGLKNYLNLKKDEQDQIEAGTVISDLARGSSAFGEINLTLLLHLGPIIFQLVMIFAVLFTTISLLFSISFLLVAIVIFLVSFHINKTSSSLFDSMYQKDNQVNSHLIHQISNSYEIKVKNAVPFQLLKFNATLDSYITTAKDRNKKIGLLMISQLFLIFLFLLIFMLFTVFLSTEKQLTPGAFVLISTYIIQLTNPFLAVSQSLMRLNGNFVALAKYRKYFDLNKENYTHSIVQDSNVLFQFINAQFLLGKRAVDHFNLTILTNKTYVVIGPTGLGKTSLMNYLMGVYQIQSGQLLYKNIDISHNFSKPIFDEVVYVAQQPVIFPYSLRENLVYNSQHIYEDSYLLQMLEQFNLLHILKKHQLTLDDDLTEIYKNFSGGEKQRICILRGLLARPQLIILDEPTAALDVDTAKNILEYIQQVVPSVIMITHSPYAMELADEVIDLEKLLN
ncbi:ABC transporter ATP-binding protein [Acinetobacter sp. V91_7]|uniref:ABC transporter ATP-binding protein n=1 Tax=unclassified Acinetobacter TaxID=196816 RepID=UPI00287C898C|nr:MULTISPECIES: ABC transporter ATP-binding protein [unclassified Acinetobacter]MDS7934075.1 ABC transporter ATP-binding protein [Acinetobacter sp. V91_4B]MDS7962439.1 ABC transporter ATP-binding protein [Acinetobacter sp. V91_7]MDS8026773.1 ABC transporter ATP-binding protein [Acinetobacter sp. V91_13]